MNSARGLAILVALVCSNASGAELPCASAERQLRDVAGNLSSTLWECTRSSRVCVAVSYPESRVVSAASIRELPAEGSAQFAMLQSPAGEEPAVCLVGLYSGGSAAAWLFRGWKIVAGKPVPIEGMEKEQMNNDAVPPRAIGNAVYGAYVKARK
jgi:hypothetical protein